MKNLAVCLATCGLIFASCSNNDIFEENNDIHSQDNINFSANTTRASINYLDQVKGGFKVFATENGNASWYINGGIYENKGSWDWQTTKHKWPTEKTKYPMNFYAFYPQTATGFDPTTTSVGSVTANITIQSDPATQTDYLAANYINVTTKPASGKLNLMFKHITSKVNFSVIAGTGANVFVQQLHMQNVGNTGTFSYNNLVWDAFTASEVGTGKYKYFPTEVVPSTTNALPTFTPATADETTKNPVYGADRHSHNLMLRPQTETKTWTNYKAKPCSRSYHT